MQSSLIGKIQKASLYAREPERVKFEEFRTSFQGEHDSYQVSYQGGRWTCTCNFFSGWGVCSHIMAIQKIMGPMLPKEAQYSASSDPTVSKGSAH